ncbi:MAG: LPS export ABC transporter periplasmic protein LptC [Saprospiraceae bacterium]|nr:LPS export ABC transporter periplasmic protein LptC [Saprospiraceae bacterium]
MTVFKLLKNKLLVRKYTEGVLLAYVFLVFIACKNDPSEAPNITRDQLSIEKGKDVEIIYSDSAKVRVRVTGPTMLYYTNRDAPKQEFPNGTVTFFYDEFQQEMSVLTGKYAIRDEKKRQVVVRDSVVWESKIDGRLETSELIWDEASNTIRSTKFTRITRAKETISGFNFQTDDKLTHWRILAPRGNFNVENFEKQIQ